MRFTPRPPALVDSKKANIPSFLWYSSTIYLLSYTVVWPSSLKKVIFFQVKKSSKISSILVIWQNTKHLCFSTYSFWINSAKMRIFAQSVTRRPYFGISTIFEVEKPPLFRKPSLEIGWFRYPARLVSLEQRPRFKNLAGLNLSPSKNLLAFGFCLIASENL